MRLPAISRPNDWRFKRGKVRNYLWLAILLLAPAAHAQSHTFCPQDGPCAYTGPFSSTGTSNINNVLYVSGFTGSDLGAQLNTAVAQCATLGLSACKYILDKPGTISTPPILPLGSSLECTATGPITLATTWPVNHRNVTLEGNGCHMNYNQDTGNSAFLFGKNMTGVVTCSGTTVTYVSGSNFAQFDPGDQFAIAGAGYNVASVTSPTSLQTTAACGAGGTYASTSMGILFVENNYAGSVVFRDWNINYTGAGTTNSSALQWQFVTHPLVVNVTASYFPTAMPATGLLNGQFDEVRFLFSKNHLLLDAATRGGITISSNMNTFRNCGMDYSTSAAGLPVLIQNSSFGNTFLGCDIEGNTATITVTVATSAYKNRFIYCDFEVNGDGTATSEDIALNGPENEVGGSTFAGGGTANHPAIGILTATGGQYIHDNRWIIGSSYNVEALNCISSATCVLANNDYGGATVPIGSQIISNQDSLGNFLATSVAPGVGILVGALPSAAANAGKMIYVTDSTAIAAEGQACTGSSTNKALAFSNGTGWKCF